MRQLQVEYATLSRLGGVCKSLKEAVCITSDVSEGCVRLSLVVGLFCLVGSGADSLLVAHFTGPRATLRRTRARRAHECASPSSRRPSMCVLCSSSSSSARAQPADSCPLARSRAGLSHLARPVDPCRGLAGCNARARCRALSLSRCVGRRSGRGRRAGKGRKARSHVGRVRGSSC